MIIESPLELIFRDLFYRLPQFAGSHDVFLKLEGLSITGSIKIKTAIALVEDLEKRGLATPGKTVLVESSSGNLGHALSLVAAIKGYEFICVTDPNATQTAVKSMELYGATVITVDERDSVGGFLGTRRAYTFEVSHVGGSSWMGTETAPHFRAARTIRAAISAVGAIC